MTVDAERVGRELRYGRLRVEVAAAAGEHDLAALVERAKPFCWVSNMLAADSRSPTCPSSSTHPAAECLRTATSCSAC